MTSVRFYGSLHLQEHKEGALVWIDISRELHRASTKWREALLFGRRDRSFEKKGALMWPSHKHETERREKGKKRK